MTKSMATRLTVLLLVSWLLMPLFLNAQNPKTIKLNEPNKKRGLSVMEALAARASATEWSTQDLSAQDLSDLLWAANGINRPDSGKKTAPSAMNAQDVDIYVFLKDGAYLYEAKTHSLIEVVSGDQRSGINGRYSSSQDRRGQPAPDNLETSRRCRANQASSRQNRASVDSNRQHHQPVLLVRSNR